MHSFLLSVLGCDASLAPLNPTDGEFDCETPTTVWVDADGDGYGDSALAEERCDLPSGYATFADDCDDSDPDRFPGGIEVCDGIDNDCDEVVDDGLDQSTFHADGDGDGYGDETQAVQACAPPPGFVVDDTDCDDTNPQAHPGSPEVCDGADNDCNGLSDEEDPGLDLTTLIPYYEDLDTDGYGDPATLQLGCVVPLGFVGDGGDCNDADPAISPGATEICSNIDEDCDGYIDDDDPDVDPASQSTFFTDADFDGFGDPFLPVFACVQPFGTADNGDDCDDGDPTVLDPQDWVQDLDGDGVGTGTSLGQWCNAPLPDAVLASAGDDCDDADATVYPGAPEVCEDGIDQDCSGADLICTFSVGSANDVPVGNSSTLRGNVFYVEGSPLLLAFGLYLDLNVDCELDYYVHTGPTDVGPWTIAWSGLAQAQAGIDFHYGPAVDLVLPDGEYVALSVGISCAMTYYADYNNWYGFDAGIGRLERTVYDNDYFAYDAAYVPPLFGSQVNLAYYMEINAIP